MNVFKEITEIYILVPALLGLKGNLEMTLASRLSTQVDSLERRKQKLKSSCHLFLGKYRKYG